MDDEGAAEALVSFESSLDELLILFSEGVDRFAVYERPEKKSGYRGMVTGRALAGFLGLNLQVSQARLQSLLQSSNDAVCMIDEHGKVVFWNNQAENLYEIKARDIVNHDIRLFFDNLVVTEVVKTKKPVLGSFHKPRPGTYVLINVYPVMMGEKVIGSVSVEKDVTSMINLNRELDQARKRADSLEGEMAKISLVSSPFAEICGRSENFRAVIDTAKKVASTDAAVLIYGESGTGKEVLARALHRGGPRQAKPFIAINCGAIPHNLFESELFGYEGGAFTGAEKKGKPGKFTLAHGGTLFLDEISELSLDLQVKLLRVLQEQVFYPVGGTSPKRVDVRIIVATNQNLAQLVEEGRFREDLYYRLNVVHLEIPPLRERKTDIPELAYLFLAEHAAAYNKNVADIDPAVMAYFLRYHWPGNIRELRNMVERMVVLSEGDTLTTHTLPPELKKIPEKLSTIISSGRSLAKATSDLERELIISTLAQYGGNKAKAAAKLGVPRSSLYYRLQKLGISEQDYLK